MCLNRMPFMLITPLCMCRFCFQCLVILEFFCDLMSGCNVRLTGFATCQETIFMEFFSAFHSFDKKEQ